MFEFFPLEKSGNVSVVVKTTAVDKAPAADPAPAEPPAEAETTDQVTALSGASADTDRDWTTEPAMADAPPVPIPPRRVIPHQLVCEELAIAAANNNLPAPFLIKLINQESGFDQNAVSRTGAQGVAQFMPETAAQMRLVDPFDPLKAVHASAQLLRSLFEQFGHKLGLAAAAYNAGPRRVQEWLDKKGKLPQETRDYVQLVTGRKAEDWKANAVAAQFRVPAHAPCQREAGLFASNGPAKIPLPQAHPDSEAGKLATQFAKNGQHKVVSAKAAAIVMASADATATIPTIEPKKVQAAAKHHTNKPKSAAVRVAAKRNANYAKSKKLQVAEARGQK